LLCGLALASLRCAQRQRFDEEADGADRPAQSCAAAVGAGVTEIAVALVLLATSGLLLEASAG